jgi:hypothetical protein
VTVTETDRNRCPNCGGAYSFAQTDGTNFCPECRKEWKPGQANHPSNVPAAGTGTEPAPPDLAPEAALAPAYSSVVNVTYRTATNPEPRTDRYTHITAEPHKPFEAIDAAELFFMEHDNVHIVRSSVFYSDPPAVGAPTIEEAIVPPAEPTADPDDAEEVRHERNTDRELGDALDELEVRADAERFLDSLIGSGVTLEGGQRGVILGFDDNDRVTVQLGDGRVEPVDFGDIVSHDQATPEVGIVANEIDDETAAIFGNATLMMACMVVEAGVGALEGEGPDYTLIEPASGWIPEDPEIMPLMEQAAALGVAMLIQAFGLPRALIAQAVEQTRAGISSAPTTEGTDDDED